MKKSSKKLKTHKQCYECSKPTNKLYDKEFCKNCFIVCVLGEKEAKMLAKQGKLK